MSLRPAVIFLMICLAAACTRDETVAAYGGAGKTWRLTELDGAPFTATATLSFAETGALAGMAPCNAYRAEMTAPYPWFDAGPIASTRRLCPHSDAEAAYFSALSEMSLSEVLGNTLILSTPEGKTMVFTADG